MKKDQQSDDIFSDSATLRKRAEAALSSNPVDQDGPDCMSPEAIKNLVHDLSVHQVELEMQNDELRRTQEELETTGDKYTDLYDFSPVGYATINDKGIITETNLTLTQMLGVERNKVVGKPFSDFVYGNDQDAFLMHRRRLSETESDRALDLKLLKMDLRLLKKEESWFYATAECMVVKNGDSPAKQIRMAVSDSSERIQSEKTIKESQQAWEDTFNAIPDWVSIIDVKTGQILETNAAGETLLGKSRKEIIGQACWNLLHGTDEPIADCSLRRMIDSGQRELSEIYLAPLKKWFSVTADPIRDGKNNISRAVHIVRDITERKQAEEKLRAGEAFLKTLLDAIPVPVFYKDRNGKYLGVNKAFEGFFGETRERLVGKSALDINPPELAEVYQAKDNELFKNGGVQRYESQVKSSKGKLHDVIFNKSIFTNSQGVVNGLIGAILDITEFKNLESKLLQTQKMEAIGTLAGGIAHDFNNILSAIIGFSELAMDRRDKDSDLTDDLSEILNAGNRAKGLVQQILSFSRQAEHKIQPFDISGLVDEIRKMLRSTIASTIGIYVDNQADSTMILGDSTQLHQVLLNLCTNAAHAMEDEGGTLEIGLRSISFDEEDKDLLPGKYLQLSVSDTGIGIAPEIINQIFDPYFTTKEIEKGTGLGLAVVHGIIKSHNGNITVYSEPGKGTTFNVYLPLIKEAEKDVLVQPEIMIAAGDERILFVDDEPSIVKMQQQRLERLGYRIVGKTSSIEALETFKATPDAFDLVVTDMTMPEMTGDRLAKELKKIRPEIPVILCTGFSKKITLAPQDSEQFQIDKLVMKPVDKAEMSEAIREVLDKVKGGVQ